MSYSEDDLPLFRQTINRRNFLKIASIISVLPAGCSFDSFFTDEVTVNDIHSRINRTTLSKLVEPKGLGSLKRTIGESKKKKIPISISGSRHAMGGQQFGEETLNFDTRSMDQILELDRENGIAKVEAGIQWPKLVEDLLDMQKGNSTTWTINQKQTGADRLSIGGAVSANAHGRRLTDKPMVQDIEALTLVDASGKTKRCSRSQNRELFQLAIGGYGLFGPIYSVELRLRERHKVRRKVSVERADGIIDQFNDRISDGFEYGDFQFSVDNQSEDFLKRGVFSCYKPVSDDTPIQDNQKQLSNRDWMKLVQLAHLNESKLFDRYANYYLSTDGQVYWSDYHQMSTYVRNYHNLMEKKTKALPDGTEMITELYVPREKLNQFLTQTGDFLKEQDAEVIYGTVRLIEEDDETFLPWAKDDYACVIFNLHVNHSKQGFQEAKRQFRGLIDIALSFDGNFFLTYHRWATKEQIEQGYPQFREFLRLKQKYDPMERFQSDWYRHYKSKFL